MITADTALDGKGGALRKTRIVIEDSKVLAIDPRAKPIDYDLRGLTVLPGWIVPTFWSVDVASAVERKYAVLDRTIEGALSR